MVLMANWFVSADTRAVTKALKWIGICVFVGVGLFFLVTGRLGWAFMALPALLPWFLRARLLVRAAKTFSRMTGGFQRPNQTSDVETPTLRMTLDHQTGEMTGVVLKGAFAGSQVEDLTEDKVLELLSFCYDEDQDAARLLESYLDRYFPSWRQHGQHTNGADGGFSSDGTMDRREAYKILGLEEGADEDLIKEAHRRLVNGLHPDHGGSDYLAAKINLAKDVLLKG